MEQITLQDNSIVGKNMCKTASEWFMRLLFLLLPLGVHDTFHNVSETKSAVFYILSAIYIISMLCIGGFGKGERGRTLHKIDLFFAAFVLTGVLSSVLSGFGMDSLGGGDNRRQGIVMFALYLVLFFLLKQYGSITHSVKRNMLFSFVIVCVMGMLNQFKLDPAGYISALIEPDRVRFTSTIGNIGFYSAYCILFFPVAYTMFLHSETIREKVLYGGASAVGVLGAMASHTESSFIGLCTAFAVIPLFLRNNAVKRFFIAMPILLALMKLYAFMVSAFNAIPLSALTETIMSGVPFWVLMGTYSFCAVIFRNVSDEGAEKVKTIYGVILCIALVFAAGVFIYANTNHAKDLPAFMEEYLIITPEWGTDRGHIWHGMTKLWESFSGREKLIGGGFGCVARWDRDHRLFSDAVIDAAHNEYFHYLLTHGIMGLTFYLAFVVSSVVRCIRNNNVIGRCLCAGCVAYAAQATVNIAQVFTTPLFFVILFMLPVSHEEEPGKEKRSSVFISCAAMVLLTAACFVVGIRCTVPA